ncbi:hypothetical protein JCM10450v2_007493 [Rhodotorula kratochvilovae]
MAKGARHELKGKGKARARERTRGDKPRLIEDPELEERVLTAQLKEAGLYAANILGDGNCLFRALSDQLYGSPSMHHAIRQEICDYLAANPDKYRLFVDEDSVKGGFEGHVREMRQNGTYGTNIELSAFVARYRRPVKVYQPNLVYVMPVEDQGPSASASSSFSPPAPPPAQSEEDKLSPRERRMKARQEKMDAKGKGKGKGKERAPSAAPELLASLAPSEPLDDSPLCIVYHSWEHYSSLRNISGPHTGPPRLRVGRVNSPAVTDTPDPAGNAQLDADVVDPDQAEEADEEDVIMAEPTDTISPPPPPPPERKRRTPRGTPPSDHPLPAVRSALSRSGASTSPPLPALPPSDSLASPSSPPSPPTSTTFTRPAKHLLDRSSPRAHSPLSSSSSSVPAPSPPADPALDSNDNDRAGPRTRSRFASPASSSSSSGASTSTGVASSFAGSAGGSGSGDGAEGGDASGASTRASSVPSEVPALAEGVEEKRRAAGRPKARPPPRERRGPTSAQRKEAARERRMERRRAVKAPSGAGAGRDEDVRVLRSGRRTSATAAAAPADAGLGRVRELYI